MSSQGQQAASASRGVVVGDTRFRRAVEWIAIVDQMFVIGPALSLFVFPSEGPPPSYLDLNSYDKKDQWIVGVIGTALHIFVTVLLATRLVFARGLVVASSQSTPIREALKKTNRWLWLNLFHICVQIIGGGSWVMFFLGLALVLVYNFKCELERAQDAN